MRNGQYQALKCLVEPSMHYNSSEHFEMKKVSASTEALSNYKLEFPAYQIRKPLQVLLEDKQKTSGFNSKSRYSKNGVADWEDKNNSRDTENISTVRMSETTEMLANRMS